MGDGRIMPQSANEKASFNLLHLLPALLFVSTSLASIIEIKHKRQQSWLLLSSYRRSLASCSSSRRGGCTNGSSSSSSNSGSSSSSSSSSSITKERVLDLRNKYFSKSLSVSYANSDPLMIVKGKECRLIDESGISYLDTRNNVAHVGHGHAHIVRAVQDQVAMLNTNTRYLHPTMTLLAERLIQQHFQRMTSPPSPGSVNDSNDDSSRLQVVFFTNSGSEANDLALRLARAYSGGSQNTIVVDGAYHGHTLGTLEVSPYKYECGCEYPPIQDNNNVTRRSPGRHIYKVPAPDVYRGKHRDSKTAGAEYASYVQDACRYYTSKGEKVRAFIVEGGMSVAGVILPPPGYLATCARAVRAAGGLYIADEVQTGLGRLGSCFWAFEYDQAHADTDQDSSSTSVTNNQEAITVPDIVTIGKPFGNGMPLAAVVTSRKVAAAFEDCGVEYFNTFGGNPVCAAAGMAVLDVIENEGLQQHALKVGNYLKNKFLVLQQERLQLIGDVRGSGLFLGVELVKDRTTRDPAPVETSYICSILKSKYRILTSIDGPHDNVLVIKPPLVFSSTDTDYFVDCFEQAATVDMVAEDLSTFNKTPT